MKKREHHRYGLWHMSVPVFDTPHFGCSSSLPQTGAICLKLLIITNHDIRSASVFQKWVMGYGLVYPSELFSPV